MRLKMYEIFMNKDRVEVHWVMCEKLYGIVLKFRVKIRVFGRVLE